MTDSESAQWPEIPFEPWKETIANLHMMTQIVGKVRLMRTPWLNHSWHVTLYVSARGLTTSTIPYGGRVFEMEFDFIDQVLVIRASDGQERRIDLKPGSIADFYAQVMAALEKIGLPVQIDEIPNEVVEAVRFGDDSTARPYDADAVHRFWLALVQVDRVLKLFRTRFLGKCSPSHFFWGSFDQSVTRFSGRSAPRHPGGFPNLSDAVTVEAYSHEVSSAGFWPGGGAVDYPAFYSYAYPVPDGFADASVQPEAAFFLKELSEFVLPYDAVRTAGDPDETLVSFLQSTYEAAADAADWDRETLECPQGQLNLPRAVPG